jgi:hypothetical protein
MPQAAQTITKPASEIVRLAQVSQAPNGICFASSGQTSIAPHDLERMVAAVPRAIAAALERKAYYFVPLTVSQGDETLIADRYDVALSDQAVCHRNFGVGDSQCVFISTRLTEDKFSVSFEFYINVGHAFVERAGVAQAFADLVWRQAQDKARGETLPSTCSRFRSTWTTSNCASASIRCWRRRRWPSACAPSPNCSPRTRASNSPSTTADGRRFSPRIDADCRGILEKLSKSVSIRVDPW